MKQLVPLLLLVAGLIACGGGGEAEPTATAATTAAATVHSTPWPAAALPTIIPDTTATVERPTVEPATDLLTYDSPDYGIRIKYPADWTKQEHVMGTVVAFFAPREGASDVLQENVNILVQDLSAQPMTLDEFTELSVGQTEQLITDASILDSSAATVGGNPGHKLVYTGKQGEYDLKWLQVWTIKDDKAYIISYTAEIDTYSAFLKTVEEMIESFEIT